MTSLRDAAQAALKELEALKERGVWGDWDGVTDALKAALAEPSVDDPHRDHWVAIAEAAQKIAASKECGLMEAKALCAALDRLTDAALAEPTVQESLQVPAEVAATLTTTDIAWLATCRLTKLWHEFGQMRWVGADEGWDRAIEAVRSHLNDECQDVLDWKAKADQSHATAVQLLRKVLGEKDD